MVMVEKYKILENFLTKDETNIYKRYCVIQHRIGAPRPHDSQVPFAMSITVHFGSDNTHEWPIYMGDNAVNLKPGDAVVYKGCEIEHKRDNFKGDWYAQAFLHYVNAEGPHREHFMDKRQIWGIPK
jgi:hypothetical protein